MTKKNCAFTSCILSFFLCFTTSAPLCSGVFADIDYCRLSQSFPSRFLFGAASSAHKFEGALNGFELADKQYQNFEEDVKAMASWGVNSYIISISWSRILPEGRGKICRKGIQHYDRLIDTLLRHGVMPVATLFSSDTPRALQEAYRGWLSPEIIQDFQAYAEICFREFGDRVKHWLTFSEPNAGFPISDDTSLLQANSSEAYMLAHNMLLAHAAAVEAFRSKFTKMSRGVIGIAVNAPWYEPLHDTEEDQAAADRIFAFTVRRILDPVVYGVYRRGMSEEGKADPLPEFDKEQSRRLRRSFDFIALNYDATFSAASRPVAVQPWPLNAHPHSDVYVSRHRGGVAVGQEGSARGIQAVVEYISILYDRPPLVLIVPHERRRLPALARESERLKLENVYLKHLWNAIRNGADVRGYLSWSNVTTAASKCWGQCRRIQTCRSRRRPGSPLRRFAGVILDAIMKRS